MSSRRAASLRTTPGTGRSLAPHLPTSQWESEAGGRGVGVGFSDAEVDAVPKHLDLLTSYHDLLDAETSEYFDRVSSDDFNRARESGPAHRHLRNLYTCAVVGHGSSPSGRARRRHEDS